MHAVGEPVHRQTNATVMEYILKKFFDPTRTGKVRVHASPTGKVDVHGCTAATGCRSNPVKGVVELHPTGLRLGLPPLTNMVCRLPTGKVVGRTPHGGRAAGGGQREQHEM